jgi:hypothetical protein
MRPPATIPGDIFGSWTVSEYVGKSWGDKQWKCICICGNSSIVLQNNLRRGLSKSCGFGECSGTTGRIPTHGDSQSAEYQSWYDMKRRCLDETNANYGGRGITFCDRWESYENFLFDMGRRPTPKHTLERLNNECDYSLDNCCWATRAAQANNRRPAYRSIY